MIYTMKFDPTTKRVMGYIYYSNENATILLDETTILIDTPLPGNYNEYIVNENNELIHDPLPLEAPETPETPETP